MSKFINKLKQQLLSFVPRDVEGTDNATYQFYFDYLYRIIKGRFEIECPEEWNIDYMLEHLIYDNVLLITDTVAGVIPLKTGVSGDNIWNRPSQFISANHILGNIEGEIGKDGACIFVNGDGYNSGNVFYDLISKYAYQLASFDANIDVNLINTRGAMIFDCANSAQEKQAKAIFDKISRGEPAVFTSLAGTNKNAGRLEFHTLNVIQTYAVDKFQDAKRTCVNEFLTMVGVRTANTDKRERLITEEVEYSNGEIQFNIAYINESLKKGCDKANELYPNINLKITFKNDSKQVSTGNREESENDDRSNDTDTKS